MQKRHPNDMPKQLDPNDIPTNRPYNLSGNYYIPGSVPSGAHLIIHGDLTVRDDVVGAQLEIDGDLRAGDIINSTVQATTATVLNVSDDSRVTIADHANMRNIIGTGKITPESPHGTYVRAGTLNAVDISNGAHITTTDRVTDTHASIMRLGNIEEDCYVNAGGNLYYNYGTGPYEAYAANILNFIDTGHGTSNEPTLVTGGKVYGQTVGDYTTVTSTRDNLDVVHAGDNSTLDSAKDLSVMSSMGDAVTLRYRGKSNIPHDQCAREKTASQQHDMGHGIIHDRRHRHYLVSSDLIGSPHYPDLKPFLDHLSKKNVPLDENLVVDPEGQLKPVHAVHAGNTPEARAWTGKLFDEYIAQQNDRQKDAQKIR